MATFAHHLIRAQQFAGDAMLLENARRAERVIGLHGGRQGTRPIVQ